jgi:transposase-like protein
MAKRGRPVKGAELVEDLGGSQAAKQRLRIILQTLAGVMTVQDACAELGIQRSGFHKLRQQFLAHATGLLEPRPRGRQPLQPSAAQIELATLRQEVTQLKLDLKAQQIREEIALVMPHLLKNKRPSVRKKKPLSDMRADSSRSVR